MEEDTPALRAWVREQHEHTMAQLSALPARAGIHRRLSELLRAPASGNVVKAGRRYFFRQRKEDEELAALYCRDTLHGAPRRLLDPNELDPGGTITLADTHPSCDGSLLAYRLSVSGSSCMSLYVMAVDSKEILPDVIPGDVNPVAHTWHTRNRVTWLPDNSGFFYTRCPHGTPAKETRFHHKLYFHRLGDHWRDDPLVFGEALKPEQTPYPVASSDGRYLAVVVQDLSGAEPRSEVYVLDREREQRGFVPIVHDSEEFVHVALHRDRLYIRTNHDAPLGKIITVTLGTHASGVLLSSGREARETRAYPADEAHETRAYPGAEARETRAYPEFATVIPEGLYPVRAWTLIANYLFVETIEDVSSRLRVYDLEGNFVKQIELPSIGSIDALFAEPESGELLFSFSSFLAPRTVYRLDLPTLTYELLHQDELRFNPENFVVEQVWFESRDQTRIPMFLLHQRGIERDGHNAAVIHGYGGFGVSLLPAFAAHVIPFLERGGIYAVVNARGGGEFGEEWHRGGMRERKQNVFDDFIAAGEWLITEGYTRSSKLGCFGWSNGGLSVNAVAVQRPDLWKAVVSGAPVTDMARFHLAHGARHWIADYGSPKEPHDLNYLMQYSPYHALPEKIEAPAILTIAPGNDDRVAPWHSYKMHARWLAANVSNNPTLLRGEGQAGHHGSPALSRRIDRYADIWAFFFWQLGLNGSSSVGPLPV
jgi:prolyl oligopeptidase